MNKKKLLDRTYIISVIKVFEESFINVFYVFQPRQLKDITDNVERKYQWYVDSALNFKSLYDILCLICLYFHSITTEAHSVNPAESFLEIYENEVWRWN